MPAPITEKERLSYENKALKAMGKKGAPKSKIADALGNPGEYRVQATIDSLIDARKAKKLSHGRWAQYAQA